MQIFDAFCEEIGEVLDIYGAREVFFQQATTERHRLNFRCSDAKCRAALNPKVSGVNYDKVVEENETYVQPHFKSIAQHKHLNDCVWMMHEARKCDEQSPQGGTRVSRAKATNVIDVFTPKKQDSTTNRKQVVRLTSAEELSEGVDDQDGTSSGSMGVSRTSRLEKFIDCWAAMEFDKRRVNKVVIEGNSISYAFAVLNPAKLLPKESGTRVIQGMVSASFWPKAQPSMLYINFKDTCVRFDAINGSHDLVIAISLLRLNQFRGSGLMRQRIEDGNKPGHYLKAYFWGEIVEAKKQGYEVKLEAIDNLVIKAVQKKSKAILTSHSE
jgi:hypothetical protein